MRGKKSDAWENARNRRAVAQTRDGGYRRANAVEAPEALDSQLARPM